MAEKISIGEKFLKRKQDPELQKQLASEQIDYEAKDEVTEIVKKSSIHEDDTKKRKRYFKLGSALVGLVAFGYLVHWLLQPFEADMRFGFCRVFLELNVRYPDKLVLSEVDERRDFVRIWYMQTDSFGEERMENIECWHGWDDTTGYYIDRIRIDRREVDPERVALFNKSLPTLMAYPPDLTYPRRLRDALGNIDIQTYLFRKPIL